MKKRAISGLFSALITMTASNSALAASQASLPKPGETPAMVIPAGTRILLVTKSSLSTRSSQNGDSFYALVDYPVFVGQTVVIPADSLIRGMVVDVQRGGRVRGRAQITLGLEQLTLINGVQKSFQAEILSVDAAAEAAAVQRGGRVQAPSDARRDAQTVIRTGSQGAIIGAIAGGGKGLAIGSAVGALVGLSIMLHTRGGDLDIAAGTGMEIVLQSPLEFGSQELDFSKAPLIPAGRRNGEIPVRRVEPVRRDACCPPYLGWPIYFTSFWIAFP